jgi:hypothetical protein
MSAKALLSASVSAGPAAYVEDVFSTYLYTGNSSTQTITNGIDLSGEGGLIYYKQRDGSWYPTMVDTVRGLNNRSFTHLTDPGDTGGNFTALSNGYQINDGNAIQNGIGLKYASWTFRKAEKFFDVVTYTGDGNGSTPRVISHNLGSVPGVIIIKTLGASSDWLVYHRSLGPDKNLRLNSTAAAQTNTSFPWQNTSPTSTTFTVTPGDGWTNGGGQTYVAYLFAHDAGGFGDAGTDSVVSCGSYTGNGSTSGPTVDLGWEPQWLLIKRASAGTGGWFLLDSMRGIATGSADASLQAESANAENTANDRLSLTSTGFQLTTTSSFFNNSGDTYIYIAIRRGPMKTPESGTEVFHAKVDRDASSTTVPSYSAPFTVDLAFSRFKTNVQGNYIGSRLQGLRRMDTTGTGAESASTDFAFDYQTGWGNIGGASANFISWMFRRAPGFFDVVAYTGTSSATTVSHNLGVVPELMIVKRRDGAGGWFVYSAPSGNTKEVQLHLPAGLSTNSCWNNTSPTSSIFSVGAGGAGTNDAGETYIAYLFATLAGVSKVGSYTGTGTTLSVDCSFTAGARFVLIKRTDSTGDWYVWDTARGIISGNDPYLLLNSTAAEVTNTDYIDPLSSGFQVSSTAPAAINASGGTYIFLAIA